MFSNSGDDASSFFVQDEFSSLCARVAVLLVSFVMLREAVRNLISCVDPSQMCFTF